MAQGPKIVEFIGVSGSGKTTLYEKLLKENKNFDGVDIAAFRGLLNNPDIKIPGKKILKVLPEKIITLLKLTKVRYLYIDQIIAYSDTSELDKTLKQIDNFLCNYTYIDKEKSILAYNILKNIADLLLVINSINENKIVLVDEFLLQKIFSLNLSEGQITNFVNELEYKVSLLINVKADANTCIERLRKRNKYRNGNIEKLTNNDLLQKIKKAQLISDKIELVCKNNKLQTMVVKQSTNAVKLKVTINSL